LTKKKILVAPLDWGLGHATRCIPIIHYLLEKNCEVAIGADGRPHELLKREFPELEHIILPGYGIEYPKKGSMALKMAVSIPKILAGIKKEHELLDKIITRKKIDAVISDNRFGLWTKKMPCVFITHQLMIKAPFGERLLHRLNKNHIKKYTECWVPDRENENNLSGDLAHKFPLPANAKFIGPLSRFRFHSPGSPGREILVLLSGPEPQRSILEQKIILQFKTAKRAVLIVQGITEKKEEVVGGRVRIISHLLARELEEAILSSRYIICRSGYSTIMDMAALGKKNVIFIPTPGQTEQEYLAERFKKTGVAYSVPQDMFDLETALKETGKFKGFEKASADSFKHAIDLLFETLQAHAPGIERG
jgi:uncharacterized protein (TIGR00661 family)